MKKITHHKVVCKSKGNAEGRKVEKVSLGDAVDVERGREGVAQAGDAAGADGIGDLLRAGGHGDDLFGGADVFGELGQVHGGRQGAGVLLRVGHRHVQQREVVGGELQQFLGVFGCEVDLEGRELGVEAVQVGEQGVALRVGHGL